MTEFIESLPQGLDTPVGEAGERLSGGQKQRISIARAFLKDAPILILDEPTSALDVGSEAQIKGALERLMVGRITFIVAHRLTTIEHADQILSMAGGKVVEQGTWKELFTKDGCSLASAVFRASARRRASDEVPPPPLLRLRGS